MNKVSAYGLGSGLTVVAIFAYGLKNKMGWKYWVFTILFLAPAGGLIASAFVPEDKEVNAFNHEQKSQLLAYGLKQDEIEACRKRECSDKGGFYFNDGRCQGEPILGSYGVEGFNYHDLNC